MTDYGALLRAVLEAPPDDAPRLVLADWLDEHGRADRAEFIRRQVGGLEPEALVEASWVYFTGGLGIDRDFSIQGPPVVRRWASADGWPRVDGKYVFGRGFAGSVTLEAPVYLDHAGALFTAHPITSVGLWDREPFEGSPQSHSWYRAGSPPPGGREFHLASNLPGPLWDALAGHVQETGGRAKWYETRAAAEAALSRACVAYGRRAAGLPPLT
ncbi:MAG TPA: TIGR02996 domain-containing protein [Gemmataceae bacterium]|jgi:uncharacterized protein (TIGR02996 family)|nr:TIGR02996 domain-containing protein [Gemmataceae bacterium]